MKIHRLEMEWTDEGCVAVAEGFDGVLLTCPRCQSPLPRGERHVCGKVDYVPQMRTNKKTARSRKLQAV